MLSSWSSVQGYDLTSVTELFSYHKNPFLDMQISCVLLSFSTSQCIMNVVVGRNLYGSIKDVVVPLMYMDYTTRKVLVMEWIEVLYHLSFAHYILERIVQCLHRVNTQNKVVVCPSA